MTYTTKIPPAFGVILGCVLYELGITSLYLYQPYVLPTVLRFLGLFTILYFAFKSPRITLNGEIAVVFRFFIIWTVFIVLRGPLIGNFRPNTESISDVIRVALIDRYGDVTYFFPLFALFSIKLDSLYYFRKTALVLSILFIILIILNRGQIIAGMLTMGRTDLVDFTGEPITVRDLVDAAFPGLGLIVFILMCYGYIKGKLTIVLPISLLLYSLCFAIGGGRGKTVFSLVYFLSFLFLLFQFPVKKEKRSKKTIIKSLFGKTKVLLVLALLIGGVIYLYNETPAFDFLFQHAFGGRDFESGEWNNNRSEITDDFFKDFNADPLSWVIGRGVNGAFLTNCFEQGELRIYMEWGFLYMILKGGVVYLMLYIYCMLHAAYKGLFHSKNLFSKALSFMCLFIIMNMLSTGANPQFSTLYILAWMSFGLVERKEIRELKDSEICNNFNIKNYSRGKKNMINTVTTDLRK